MKMRNCAIYCRISPTGSHNEDLNATNQMASCIEYAKNFNYIVFKTYTDIISGKTSKRTDLNKLMIDARAHKFSVVVVWKLDRLGRSLKHLLNVIEEFKNLDIDFACVSQRFDTTSPSGNLIFQVLGAVSEFERELISERTKQGLKQAKNVGKRGKDKKPRKKSGYYMRYHKEK